MTKPRSAWKPGQSGNPAGRPNGVGEAGQIRALIRKDLEAIVRKLVEKAKDGDATAARLLLDRVVAPIRAGELPVSIELPSGSMTEQAEAVLQATANGELAPDQGAQVLGAMASVAKIRETDELNRRILELEKQHAKS